MSVRVKSIESCAGCNRSWYVDDGKGEQRQYICGSCGKCMNCEDAYARGKSDGMAEAIAFIKDAEPGPPRIWLAEILDALEREGHKK